MSATRLTSRRRQDPGSKWARIAIAILATIGVIDTGSITLNRWGWLGSLTCPGGLEGCDKVLNSAWGTIFANNGFDIPLSLLGLISYSAVLVMAILPLLPGLSENKAELSRKTWWGLFLASCSMGVFSMLLIGLMVFKIEAFCLFCVLSAFISLTILILTVIGGGWDDPGKVIFRGILISLVILLGGLIWISAVDPQRPKTVLSKEGIPPKVINKSNTSKVSLARHLKSSGAIMYSAYWCPHCHDQKEMFGAEAASELMIIECATDGEDSKYELCQAKGIDGYPSWEINGIIESGVRPLEELANASRYKGERDF